MGNVAILAPHYDGSGPSRGALAIADLLCENFNVTVYFVKPPTVELEPKLYDVVHLNGLLPAFFLLLRNISPNTVAVISLCFVPDIVNILVCKFKNCRSIVSVRANHHNVYGDIFGPLLGWALATLHDYLLKFCDVVIFLSQEARDRYKSRIRQKAVVILNFDTARQNYQKYEGRRFSPIIVSRLTDGKVSLDSIKLISKCRDRCNRLTVFGEGPFREIISAEGSRHNVEIDFRGWVDNPLEVLPVNSILIQLSTSEGFPRSVLEAVNCGIPVFMNKIEGYESYSRELPSVKFMDRCATLDDLNFEFRALMDEPRLSNEELQRWRQSYLKKIQIKLIELLE